MAKHTISIEDFGGYEFQLLMASGDSRRLWANAKDGRLSYKVENLKNSGELVVETRSLGEAVRVFNNLPIWEEIRLSNVNQGLVQWLANGKRGISSNTIATRLSGIDCLGTYANGVPRNESYPRDPSDFIKCQKLLKAVPGFRNRLDEMKSVSKEWAILVNHWSEIEGLIESDFRETNGKRCPTAYSRMKELLDSVRD